MLSKPSILANFLIEETLGLLHTEDVVECLLPTHCPLNEETLGLLHRVEVVEGGKPEQHLTGEEHEPLTVEVMEDEGEENH